MQPRLLPDIAKASILTGWNALTFSPARQSCGGQEVMLHLPGKLVAEWGIGKACARKITMTGASSPKHFDQSQSLGQITLL